MELLQHRDAEGLERIVADNPSVVRFLQGRLWDTDPEVRRLAAEAVGAAATLHPDLGREILRRALWALNDESATNGAPMLLAIGEIGRRSPDLAEPFIGPMTAYLRDDGLRPGILAALARIADTAPELIEGVRDRLLVLDNVNEPGERAVLDRLLTMNREGVDGE